MNICKNLPKDAPARLRRVLIRVLILSLPTLVLNLIIQGRREFAQELETNRKYRKLTAKTIRKG